MQSFFTEYNFMLCVYLLLLDEELMEFAVYPYFCILISGGVKHTLGLM